MMRCFYEELRLRRKSPRTTRSYLGCLKMFFSVYTGVRPQPEDFRQFILAKHERENLAASSLNGYKQAFQSFSRLVLRVHWKIPIPAAKRRQALPVVMSHEEIEKILAQIKNHKHWLMIALAYGAGLRVSEVMSLKVADLDFERRLIHVKHGKGDKDRVTLMPGKLEQQLRLWVQLRNPSDLVFESDRRGKLSSRSAQKVFERAVTLAGIQKEVSFHTLRHSFATHLIERGTNLRYVQSLLGHSSIRTTQIYTQVANEALMRIESPF